MSLSIQTIVSNHFKMMFRNMNNKFLDKLKSMNLFSNSSTILMPIIEEGNKLTIIIKDPRLSHGRPTSIANNVFNRIRRLRFQVRLSINIETIFVGFKELSLQFVKGIAKIKVK